MRVARGVFPAAFTGPYYVVNTATNEAIQSEATRVHADHACRTLNDHETTNNRPAVYAVVTRPESETR